MASYSSIDPEKLSNSLTRMKVQLLEVPTASSTAEIPTVKKQEPMPTEAQSDTPSLASAVTGYQHVQGTGFSVYTSVVGGSVNSILLTRFPND